ncbi:hypothetical protein NBO_427g0001 [Nosema bombycis CQ1]|uniref:Uncharacterized protein n=1 Tax=Nosema bombycis (strain CQ1 / CVCC 102059) TaxID=578461 RepID=R0M396_NOSB1|nr:hypothetical protein NBO_427g0001 [Nosema bombycis CQ1]|eukprot:EOB12484.1 hypothetical protein NBO_427g0001 [Nosema bombycis CQ1]
MKVTTTTPLPYCYNHKFKIPFYFILFVVFYKAQAEKLIIININNITPIITPIVI